MSPRLLTLILCAAAAVAPSCRSSKDETNKERERAATATQVHACIAALDRTNRASDEYLAQLARGCSPACPGLRDYAAALSAPRLDEDAVWEALQGCEPACSEQAMSRAQAVGLGSRFPALAAACGPEFFALPRGYEEAASAVTLVTGRIHKWLERTRSALPDSDQRRLNAARDRGHVLLPPPSALSAHYRLPEAKAGRAFHSHAYVTIGRKAVSAAATPIVRLRGRTLELRPVPGGRPPGAPLVAGREKRVLAELHDSWADLHPRSDDAPKVLAYLVDADLPAARMVAVARKLGHSTYRLGVAGLSTREHRVALVEGTSSAAPVLRVGKDGEIAESTLDALRAALIERAPTALVELRIDGKTTTQQLAAALDSIDAAGGRQAMLVVAD